jgi:eukaryotic-like serine/threonine-protein kinase
MAPVAPAREPSSRADIARATSTRLLETMDLRRGRLFHLFLVALNTAVLLWIVIDGDRSPLAKWTMLAVGVAIVSGGVSLAIGRSSTQIRFSTAGPLVIPIFIAAAATSYYAGIFSPAIMTYGVAIYAFGTSRSPRLARTTYACCAIIVGVTMLLVALEVVPENGRMAPHAERSLLLTTTIFTQMVFAGIYSYARQTGEALRRSVEGMADALQEAERREALFGEARADLERVLHARAGPSTGTLVGSWRLGVVLGRGGMGEVYAGVHVTEGSRAAVKLLAEDSARDPELRERFQREAAVLARLEHPNVVRLLDFSDRHIAMELLEGRDLAAVLRERRALSIAEVIDLVTQVASALDTAREAQIVHRDLKPQNIFCCGRENESPTWKVLDFGIARLGPSNATLTQGAAIGTLAYMAPEQLDGKEIDHRADVFGLALVAYRALTGRPAFAAREQMKLIADVLTRQPLAPSVVGGLGVEFDYVLALGLAKKPADRFDSAGAFAKALVQASEKKLAAPLRERAIALLARQPWGSTTLNDHRSEG